MKLRELKEQIILKGGGKDCRQRFNEIAEGLGNGNVPQEAVRYVLEGGSAAEENKGSVSTVCQDVTTYSQEQRNVYSYSTITFEVDGELFTIRFQRY